MNGMHTTRLRRGGRTFPAALAFSVLAMLLPVAATAQQRATSPAANTVQPKINPAFNQSYAQRPVQPRNNAAGNPRQHLGEWMDSHRSLPLDQQQRALEREPGFQQLRPEVQQHMRDRLSQLNGMTPERRQQAIARTEAMERLSPDQRQQVRNAAGQLGSLPEDRRRLVARAFHDLRGLPEQQRQQYLNSPQYRGQFTNQERETLDRLLSVSPYLPMPQRAPPAPAQF